MDFSESTFDGWLDRALREVPVPVGMLERLRRIPVSSDAALDAAVRDVPVPVSLRGRLEGIGRRRLRWARLSQMAVAAGLMAAIGFSYLGAMLVFLWTAYRSPGPPPPRLVSRVTVDLPGASDRTGADFDGVELALAEPAPGTRLAAAPGADLPQFQLVAYVRPLFSPLGEMQRLFVGRFNPGGWDPLDDRTLARWPVLAAPNLPEELPELRQAAGLDRRGVAVPAVDGADPAFVLQTGFNPLVFPGAHPQLATSVVPLEVDARSYDLTRQWVERGVRPPPRQLRTEELLAAIDYHLPRPKRGPVALHVAGGPSPFGFGQRHLLQVGLQARDIPTRDHPPTHVTFAIDASGSMGEGGSLGSVRRALRQFRDSLDGDDRVSLVVFRESAQPLAEEIGPDDWDELVAAVDALAPGGSTNVAAGLRQAYAVACRRLRDGGRANAVVLLTDSSGQLDAVTAERIHPRLVEAADWGIALHVIGLGPATWEEEPTGILASLARAVGGGAHQARDSEGIGRALREVLTGKSQRVASDVRLKVTFNPKSVAAYRLLGHEAGEVPADLETDFHAGRSATALYEVQLRQRGEKLVAEVEASWRDPATGQPASLTRRFRRGQFARSLLDAPLSIQAATVVAEAAEVLRGSPFVGPRPNPRSLAPVLDRARQVDTRVRDEPTFAEFVGLMERAEAAKPHRSGG